MLKKLIDYVINNKQLEAIEKVAIEFIDEAVSPMPDVPCNKKQ